MAEVKRMRSLPKDSLPQDRSAIPSSIDRRQFLAASGGLLAAAVPGNALRADATEFMISSASEIGRAHV